MEVTERLTLEAASEHTLLASEHVHRYEFAAALCEGGRTLDMCCGTGYGSAILARRARSVVGVDIDVATIETAARSLGDDDRLDFVARDALAFLRRCEPNDFDVLVCFEGLEHLDNLDDVSRELARLRSGGMRLIVSVPNSEMWEEENRFHLTSFSIDLARKTFDTIGADTLLVQNLAEGSLIVDPSSPTSTIVPAVRWAERVELEYANHFIGLGGIDRTLAAEALSASLGFTSAPTYNRHIRNIEVANRELWLTNARLGRSAFSHSGSAAAVRTHRRSQEDERYRERIAELEREVQSLNQQLGSVDEVLQRYIAAAQRRARRPARRVARVLARTAVRVGGRRGSIRK